MLSKKEKEILKVALAQIPQAERLIDQIEKLDALKDIAVIATADAVDAATTQALANELKAKMNELLNSLK